MSRISTYPIDTVVDTADLLIGTDSEDQNITKNYTIASIISLAESSIDLAEVLAVGNTATNNINLTGIMTATTVNGTNGTIGVFSSTTGTIVTLGSTTGNITTVNSTNIVNSALVSTANLTATAGITNNLLYIDSLGYSGTANQVLLSTGTATQWGNQVTSTWDLTADTGGPLTISNEDGVNVNGGTYITTTLSVPITDKVISIIHDNTARTDTPLTPTALAHGGTFTAISSATTNATGHVTATDVTTYTLPSSSNSGGYFGGRLSNNVVSTTMPLVNNYYVVNFDWANIISSLWSDRTNTGGYDSGFQYTGATTTIFNIICNFSLTGFPVGNLVTFALYANGNIITGSEQEMESSSLYYSVGTVQAMISLQTDDYIELWVTSNNSLSVILQTVSVSVTAV